MAELSEAEMMARIKKLKNDIRDLHIHQEAASSVVIGHPAGYGLGSQQQSRVQSRSGTLSRNSGYRTLTPVPNNPNAKTKEQAELEAIQLLKPFETTNDPEHNRSLCIRLTQLWADKLAGLVHQSVTNHSQLQALEKKRATLSAEEHGYSIEEPVSDIVYPSKPELVNLHPTSENVVSLLNHLVEKSHHDSARLARFSYTNARYKAVIIKEQAKIRDMKMSIELMAQVLSDKTGTVVIPNAWMPEKQAVAEVQTTLSGDAGTPVPPKVRSVPVPSRFQYDRHLASTPGPRSTSSSSKQQQQRGSPRRAQTSLGKRPNALLQAEMMQQQENNQKKLQLELEEARSRLSRAESQASQSLAIGAEIDELKRTLKQTKALHTQTSKENSSLHEAVKRMQDLLKQHSIPVPADIFTARSPPPAAKKSNQAKKKKQVQPSAVYAQAPPDFGDFGADGGSGQSKKTAVGEGGSDGGGGDGSEQKVASTPTAGGGEDEAAATAAASSEREEEQKLGEEGRRSKDKRERRASGPPDVIKEEVKRAKEKPPPKPEKPEKPEKQQKKEQSR
mmetsp:Transcript_14416/g.28147  ORF Transcript_14416/g.28147 Transcript_14416/m.28147 type:complete len:560 (+) Transcript_14416:13-1692(+)